MSSRWLLRWLQAALWLRVISFVAAGVVLISLLWYSWLYPAQQHLQRLQQQQQQRTQRFQSRKQSLLALPPLSTLQQQIDRSAQQLTAETAAAFSLPALLSTTGAALVRWQPNGDGGELALDVSWQQFTGVLKYLSSRRPAVAVTIFTLRAAQPQLRLVLEFGDEN